MVKLYPPLILYMFFLISGAQQTVCGQTQNRSLDSLLLAVRSDKLDTNKLLNLIKISREYINMSENDTALFYTQKIRRLSAAVFKDAKDTVVKKTALRTEAIAYSTEGTIYHNTGNFHEALKSHTSALKILQRIVRPTAEASTYNNIGLVYYNLGNYPEAIKNYLMALKIYERIGHKQGIANAYNNIGNVYYSQKNYPLALKNLTASLKIKQAIGDRKGEASSYNNIGLVYYSQANFPEALKNHQASLKINKEEVDDQIGLAASYHNIGNVYTHLDNYEEALKNFFASLSIKSVAENKASMASTYVNIGTVLKLQKKYKQALEYMLKAKDMARETGHKEFSKDAYSALTQLDSVMGDFRSAFEHQKLYSLYRDSIDNEETRRQTVQSQMTFDFEKKEAVAEAEHKKELESQNVLAEEKNRKQKIVIGMVALGLVLVMVFSGFIFRSLRVTRKQKDIIEAQKNTVEQQKHIVEEHQKEIIDSITYAKRLQQAILPSEDEIKKHLPDSFMLYHPKDIVAGDFYWLHESVIKENDRIIFIAAADSTGHGVPGAMVSVVCSNALNRAVNEFGLTDTGKILDKTRELVLETFAKSGEEIKDGMDISLLAIHKKMNKVYWSGANNQLWYIQNSQDENKVMQEIKADKQPIGKMDHPRPFTTHTIELQAGDIFYLMTDGYPDQFGGPKGKKYKYKQLEESLLAIHNKPLANQYKILVDQFNHWKGNLEQVDDVTIIGIRV